MYECNRCLHNFGQKNHLLNHLKRKHVCSVATNGENISCDMLIERLYPKKNFICGCGKAYKTKYILNKHKKTCDFCRTYYKRN